MVRKLPWQNGVLDEWSICGCNHYHVNGSKFIFVSMTKDGVCITEEGKDDRYLWNRLWHKADLLNVPKQDDRS